MKINFYLSRTEIVAHEKMNKQLLNASNVYRYMIIMVMALYKV